MSRLMKPTLLAGWLFAAAGMVAAQDAPRQTAPDAPLFEGMGQHQRKIATSSPGAQKYFNQGLTWAYAFNHDEAIRSFRPPPRSIPTVRWRGGGSPCATGRTSTTP